MPGAVPGAFHTLNQAPLPGTLGGPCNPHCSAQEPALESPKDKAGEDAQGRDPHSPGEKRPEPSQGVSV